MANTVTETALVAVQRKLTEIYGNTLTPSQQPLDRAFQTAQALMENNRANVSPLTNLRTGECRTFEIGWHKLAEKATVTLDGDYSDAGTSCDVTEGDFPETDKATFANNILVREPFTVDDNLCGNLFNSTGNTGHGVAMNPEQEAAAELIAGELNLAMAAIRGALNIRYVDYLDSLKTPINRDNSLPSYITYDGGTDAFILDATLMQSPRTLTDFDAIAINNRLGAERFFVNGRHAWYNVTTDANFRVLNDNEGEYARFRNYRMYFDIRDLDYRLDATNTLAHSFVVSPGSYATWNTYYSSLVPTKLGFNDTHETYAYRIADPFLRISNGRTLEPVYYEVVFTQKCAGRRQTSQQFYNNFTWEISFHGGFALAPAAANGHTGALKFTGNLGV